MVQQLDRDLISKENTIHKQHDKLAEKDAVIHYNRGHIESLRQKIKVHEEKVKDRIGYTFCKLVVRNCDHPFLLSLAVSD